MVIISTLQKHGLYEIYRLFVMKRGLVGSEFIKIPKMPFDSESMVDYKALFRFVIVSM